MQPVITAIREMDNPLEAAESSGFLVRLLSLRWASVAVAAALLVLVCGAAWLLLPGWLSSPPHAPAADLSRAMQQLERLGMEDYSTRAAGDARLLAALELFRRNRPAAALDAAVALLPPAGEISLAVHLAARCQLALDRPAAAARLLAEHPVPPTHPLYRDYLWVRAVAALGQGRHEAAVADLETLARQPGINQRESVDLLQKMR